MSKYFKLNYDFLILLVFGLLLFFPVALQMPGQSLDSSWVMCMNYVVTHHLVLGTDIVFTYGLFPYLVTFAYAPGLLVPLLGLWFLFVFTLLFYSYHLLDFSNRLMRIVLPLVLLAVASFYMEVFYIIYLLVFFLYVLKINKINWAIGLGCFLLAVISFIKFSFVTNVFIILFVLSYVDLLKRRIPYLITIYCLSVLFLVFHYAAHLEFVALAKGVVQIILGYNNAMGLGGSQFFLIILYWSYAIFLSRFFISLQFYTDIRLNKLSLLVFLAFFFLMFKVSFVRADAHTNIGFIYELSFGLFVLMLYFAKSSKINMKALNKNIYAIMIISLALMLGFQFRLPNPIQSIRNYMSYFTLDETYQSKLALLKEKYPLPVVQGNADIYSHDQTILLANNIVYNPRPVFQSYSAYTPYLLMLNQRHLLSAQAPDNIFFAIQPIDNRYPSIEDGLSWPLLLSHYALKQRLENYLWLTKRPKETIKPIVIKPVLQNSYLPGTTIILPKNLLNKYLWLQITFPHSIASGVVDLLFKPVQMYLTVTLVNGQTIQYRFVSGMGAAGFLFSPLIQNTSEFGHLYSANGRAQLLNSNQIQSFSISYRGWQSFFMPKTYQITFSELSF